jgi:hypothetical protein
MYRLITLAPRAVFFAAKEVLAAREAVRLGDGHGERRTEPAASHPEEERREADAITSAARDVDGRQHRYHANRKRGDWPDSVSRGHLVFLL